MEAGKYALPRASEVEILPSPQQLLQVFQMAPLRLHRKEQHAIAVRITNTVTKRPSSYTLFCDNILRKTASDIWNSERTTSKIGTLYI